MNDPLRAIVDTIGQALEGRECFRGDPKLVPPVYIGNGWLVPSWITEHPEVLKDDEVVAYLVRVGFLSGRAYLDKYVLTKMQKRGQMSTTAAYFRNRVTGEIRALTDPGLTAFVDEGMWAELDISEIGMLITRSYSPAVPNVQTWGPDFQVLDFRQVLQISIAKLFEVESAAGVSSRAVDFARIFDVRDLGSLKACTKMVLLGAKMGEADDWAAYSIGMDYLMAYNNVGFNQDFVWGLFSYGDKLLQGSAELLFPTFKSMGLKYRR